MVYYLNDESSKLTIAQGILSQEIANIHPFIFAAMYRLLRRIFFLLEAERAHYIAMNLFQFLCSFPFFRKIIANAFTPNSTHPTQFLGLPFKNPVGLGAGFDKNALYLRELETLGFGFVEIGTVTPKPQTGNAQPRLFRLPKDKALINRMGFNNDGVEVIAERLKKWNEKSWRLEVRSSKLAPNEKRETRNRMLIGGNIGKNKTTPNEEAWTDYDTCFTALHPYVDFFVVNVSSPNTPGLRELQEKEPLKKILVHLQTRNKTFAKQKPILLKIAPDLSIEQINDVLDLANEIKLQGLVATNTTINRSELQTSSHQLQTIGAGGLSGKPLQRRSTEIIQYIHQQTKGTIPIIGSGGIFTSADAKEKMAAGAHLVEVWTGFIYEGPSIVKNICNSLNN